ncbi:3-deoxy-D-manno-octulosonic acid transferase [Vaginella massiliensis]|uniref:3-deoxy-D-manno-octulosonic acid transferase n=1 Tax=Vaginella massiliensis TaxID=1816680 RepID=UPI000838B19C|nr:glycosyltransferase N-terminal domain-containing protein [Vaginella massiliensis]
MQMIYNIFIFFYGAALRLASSFHPKAKLWIDGRKDWENKLRKALDHTKPTLWIHCSSLGEFEQGKPVIEALKKYYPKHQIALSFFSPSGYEVRKNYKGADYIFYLPLDSKQNAEKLVELLKPELLILVKYEYWYNLIQALHQNGIPIVVVSAIFRKSQNFFKNRGKNWFANKLRMIDHFFVQNEQSASLLNQIGIRQATVAGDTRFDRVKGLINEAFHDAKIEQFVAKNSVLILGSSWPQDEKLLQQHLQQNPLPENWKIMIAPHNIAEKSIEATNQKFPDAIRYTQATTLDRPILILDTIGMLSKLYRYAEIVMIGGGFGAGIHNTLEAATYGKPIIIGPKYQKFQEAIDQIENGNLISVQNQREFDKVLIELIANPEKRTSMSEKAYSYVHHQKNSTSIIIDKIADIMNS